MKQKLVLSICAVVGLLAVSCGGWRRNDYANSAPPAAPISTNQSATENAIRFLEDRVKRDPDDFIALNKLAAYYLRRQRETGSLDYIELAARAARSSLAAIHEEENKGGLTALAHAEYAAHEFSSARDHALRLTDLDPGKSYPYQILADALLELGDYSAAPRAVGAMERLGAGTIGVESRLGRYKLLGGEIAAATKHFSNALSLAINAEPPNAETIAWCNWQLGEIAFSMGDYKAAEKRYGDALLTLPNYYRALASLGRVLAAEGDLEGAIHNYERAIHILPDPTFVSALGDLYKLAGRSADAAAQFALVEQIARLSKAHGSVYNRQIALFYADHDMKAEEAYQGAAAEYQVRHDIFGADAVAWTALKSGRLSEAQSAINEALRLGTRDARLLYHAGMIALERKDYASARDFLERALALNPGFDPLQALNARRALDYCANW